MNAEAVYLRLPVALQHVGCSLVGLRTERTRYAGAFPRLVEEAEARTFWPVERTLAYRDERLRATVQHAAATVPFWRDRFRELGIDPREIETLDDLSRLPILEKADLQAARLDDLVSSAVPPRERRTVHTSGTTGGGLRFVSTLRASQEQWAIWWRYRHWHGIREKTWCGYFAGRSVVPVGQARPPFWRVNWPGRQILFSGYHMSERNLDAYVGELRRRRPQWFHGYPSLLALLAGYVLERGVDLGYRVRWITIGAESLLAHQSELIERAFGVAPLQHYGLTEGVANASQCELGTLHVDEDFAAVEFVPAEQTGSFWIVGTNLTNPASPFIRYRTDDLATVVPGARCSCGRPGRVVERFDGRIEDYVVLPNGARVGRMDHIFKDMVNVKEAQIHQASVDRITIRVVRGERYGPHDEDELLREARKRTGDDLDVRIEYVDSLPRSRTGKLRLVVSELAGASAAAPPVAGVEPRA